METPPFKVLRVIDNYSDHFSLVITMQHPDGGLASHYHPSAAACGILGHECLHEILPMENCWKRL